MTTPRVHCDLGLSSDLATIRIASKQRLPHADDSALGLVQIAELCRRRMAGRPSLAPHEIRHELLTIAADWDLARDNLDAQSDDCVRRLAELVR
jgi:hypothetical protein